MIMAFSDGELVGVIEYVEGDSWRKAHWRVYTAHKDPARYRGFDHDECIGSFDTVFESKRAIETYLLKEPARKNSYVDVKYLPMYDNGDFYPTPSKLAGKMLRKIDWKHVATVLEPSAGKGDLAKAFCAMSANHRFSNYGIYNAHNSRREDGTCLDVIESDPNLRAILKGDGYRVVGDDFLTFFTGKHYDAVIMNPPFANGDEHLLKAIELAAGGGQIVCLLNAETIRNPYTVRRKILQQQLAKYNAGIEFVEDAFKHAERRSNVEVAIVYLNIPERKRESRIFERMKKAEDERYLRDHREDPEALVSANWIEQLVSHYNLELRCGLELMDEYAALCPHIMESEIEYAHPLIGLTITGHKVDGKLGTSDVNQFLMALRYKYWSLLFERREITSLMTSQMQEDYRSKLREMRQYDFTAFNINELLDELKVQLSQGVHDSILKLFDEFSGEHAWYPECKNTIHYYNGWATNKAHKIGKKAILPINGVYSEKWHSQNGQLDSYHINGVISDLERAMNYLDRGETDCRVSVSGSVQRAIDRGETVVHFTWFDAKFYKKGTCHITFLPEAERIIERLNIYAGRHKNWLPPCYGKKRYSDMTAEEKRVIDEFQGEDEYTNKIMAQPGLYLQDSAQMLALPMGM